VRKPEFQVAWNFNFRGDEKYIFKIGRGICYGERRVGRSPLARMARLSRGGGGRRNEFGKSSVPGIA